MSQEMLKSTWLKFTLTFQNISIFKLLKQYHIVYLYSFLINQKDFFYNSLT